MNLENLQPFVEELKTAIRQAQNQALQSVNKVLIQLYLTIGQRIVEKQDQYGWGKSIVSQISEELQNEFVGTKGFSAQNLWNMRQFYLAYQDQPKLQTLSREISWSHNVKILQKLKDPLAQQFYIQASMQNRWSVRVLDHQIDNQTYEKTLLNQTNFAQTLPAELQNQTQQLIKDEYTFDFLGLSEQHSEKQLEDALILEVRNFLTQMGADFTFMGNQYKLTIDHEDYYIDLLLYHRRLKSLIAVELKIGKFKPEYAGKLSFYLTALNETVKLPDENPSIGIIICKEKQRTTVEFALKDINQPIGVATYKLAHELPKELQASLPSPQQIEQKLSKLFEQVGSEQGE
ncbi:PDDEXK nuclease domain-containing protein [Thiomicrorhabdus aquaedulcis]|uniref:PDDEXK nuclease domain-containing protein n=1 Tax=Thiomicrorhabdus aquaedulcis TaxID=2211106 RepID=UPI000FD818A9|nr:PDDEXK nuclease domain-containing protein [Thiomicrorhabdus aquaedulcis]